MNQAKITVMENKITKEYKNLAGMTVLKDGKTLYEHYFNGCTKHSRIHIYSVTKSIVSILIGIAIDQGYIKNTDQKVLEFFPDYTVKKREKTIQDITLKDLITMTAPYKYKFAPYIKYFTSEDWVTFTLDLLGGKKQPGKFRYAPLIGPDILCGILRNATGQSVLEFAADNLFSPLGITVERSITFQSKEEQMAFNKADNISGWVSDPSGGHSGGWGLTLSPSDMAKIGQLYLDNGLWNGSQIVSSGWVKESTKEHSRWDQQKLSYGYLWWVNNDHEFSAMGDGGNVIYVNVEKNIVISIAAFFKPNVTDRIEFIKEFVEPAIED